MSFPDVTNAVSHWAFLPTLVRLALALGTGAFVGLEAVVTEVLSPKERVKILMDFLGRKMEAEVECSSVLRQVAHPLVA